MKGNQTGVAVIAREVENGGGGGGASMARIAISAGAFLKIKKTTVCVPLPGTEINFVSQFSLSHMLRCGAVAKCLVSVINGRWLQTHILYTLQARTLNNARQPKTHLLCSFWLLSR